MVVSQAPRGSSPRQVWLGRHMGPVWPVISLSHVPLGLTENLWHLSFAEMQASLTTLMLKARYDTNVREAEQQWLTKWRPIKQLATKWRLITPGVFLPLRTTE